MEQVDKPFIDNDDEMEDVETESFLDMAMKQKSEEDQFDLFYSVERGRKDQYFFITSKKMQEEAEAHIDEMIDEVINVYGEERCKVCFNSRPGTVPEREAKLKVSTYMTDYIKKIGLGEMSGIEGVDDDSINPPLEKKRQQVLLSYNESDKENAWNIPLF